MPNKKEKPRDKETKKKNKAIKKAEEKLRTYIRRKYGRMNEKTDK